MAFLSKISIISFCPEKSENMFTQFQMTHNPVYSPEDMEVTTSLSRVLDKEMQETMVRCTKETKPDLQDKSQCWCWTGGGRSQEGENYKTALDHNRYHLYSIFIFYLLPLFRGKLLGLLWTCVLLVIWLICYVILSQLGVV